MKRQDRVEAFAGDNFGHVNIGRNGRLDFSVTGQSAAADHAPKVFFDDERTRRVGQRVGQAVAGEMSADDALKRLAADIDEQVKAASK